MFPYMEKRALYDEYGEVIRAEDYMMLNPYDEPAPVVRKRVSISGTIRVSVLRTNRRTETWPGSQRRARQCTAASSPRGNSVQNHRQEH